MFTVLLKDVSRVVHESSLNTFYVIIVIIAVVLSSRNSRPPPPLRPRRHLWTIPYCPRGKIEDYNHCELGQKSGSIMQPYLFSTHLNWPRLSWVWERDSIKKTIKKATFISLKDSIDCLFVKWYFFPQKNIISSRQNVYFKKCNGIGQLT